MYHSVTFGNKNSWDDWCLVAEREPIIAPPSVKTNFIDVPGANGALDMSESLTGYPIYNNREGSISFIAMSRNASSQPECSPYKIRDLATNIMEYLHGKRMKMILEDDDQYYYEGRFDLESVEQDDHFNRLSIRYNLYPYKKSILSSIDDWLWDPFNFRTGVITKRLLFEVLITTTTKKITLTTKEAGSEPIIPTLVTVGYMMFRFVNPTLGIDDTSALAPGTHKINDYILFGDGIEIYAWTTSGTATLTIDFRAGRL